MKERVIKIIDDLLSLPANEDSIKSYVSKLSKVDASLVNLTIEALNEQIYPKLKERLVDTERD
jgi:hypothetical protein